METQSTLVLMPSPFTAEIPAGTIGQNHSSSSAGVEQTLGSLEETTLDEPVLRTVLRDVRMVVDKMRKVILLSADTRDELRNWSVWPLSCVELI